MTNFWNNRTAITAGLTIALVGTFYVYQCQNSSTFTMPSTSPSTSNGVPGLEFELSQISQHPPSLLVTLKNNHPTTSYTILTWGTPLDSSALNTGVFTLVDEDSGKEIEQVDLQINRKMPPSQDELVTVAPGAEQTVEVVLDKPWMPNKQSAKYKVKAEGEFEGVWRKHKSDLTEDELYAYLDSSYSGKKFTTNEIVLETH